jgi:uncharacterized protein (TIGR01777 family)
MKVLITGGTGFIGTEVTKKIIEQGNEVVLLTRSKPGPDSKLKFTGVSFYQYGYKKDSKIPQDLMKGVGAVINMAGEPIFTGRWNKEKMKKIKESRINITRQLVDSISRMKGKKPSTLISASAVGYYGPSDEIKLTEDSPAGNDFLSQVSLQWEAEALKAADLGVRVVILRTGIVLGKGGGALAKMILPFKLFIGGPIGSGNQYFSWMHMDDMVKLYKTSIDDKRLSGPINATAPNPVAMKELSRTIGKVLKRPSWFPVPVFLAKIVIGGSAQVVATGQRVIPKKLLSLDFPFNYRDVEEALKASLF